MIVLVDTGGGNLQSVISAFERLGASVCVSNSAADIRNASHVVLPGVGSADKVMQRLHAIGLIDVLVSLTKPVLGICVGMQIFFDHSEEGRVDGLGIVPGVVKKIPAVPGLILPHMGWNTLEIQIPCPLLNHIPNKAYLYYVHSYAAAPTVFTAAVCDHVGLFSAVVQKNNFFGVQFHPERSGEVGRQVLMNFLKEDEQ